MKHPGPIRRGVPVTDGTPAPCRQKNAASFLAGETPGVMAAYGQGEREPGSPFPPWRVRTPSAPSPTGGGRPPTGEPHSAAAPWLRGGAALPRAGRS